MAVKIKDRPKGSGVWWVFINHQGKRKAKKIGKDKRLAREVAKKIGKKLLLNEFDMNPRGKYPTFKEYAQLWISFPNERKLSTTLNYKRNLKNHIIPHLGALRINEVERKDIKLMFDTLLTKGFSAGSFTSIKAPLNGILTHAMDSQLIDNNPLMNLKFKNKKSYRVNPLTEGQAWQVLDKAKEYEKGAFYPFLLCSLRTGMRIGEIQALEWRDVDFDKRLIDVNKTWSHGRITETKNKRTRKVDMTPHLAETLRALHLSQKKEALRTKKAVPFRVFANPGTKVLCRNLSREAFNDCLDKAGLHRIHIHDLRHSYATIRLLKGHNPGDISYQLGHSSISITYDVYGHWIPGRFKSEIDELDMQLNATETQPDKEIFKKV